MTRDDIFRMARETRLVPEWLELCKKDEEALGRFFHAAYAAGAAAEREAIIQMMPGGHSVDPQWVCDAIRARTP